jgi:hypothetical protein
MGVVITIYTIGLAVCFYGAYSIGYITGYREAIYYRSKLWNGRR